MPFHIQPIREFLVRPAVPETLSRMTELAYNVVWSWEPIVRALFRRLDSSLWRERGDKTGGNLGGVFPPPPPRAAPNARVLDTSPPVRPSHHRRSPCVC